MQLTELVKKAGRTFICGNGGSAANAVHIANDLISVGVKAHALTGDVATLTAIGNDFSYEDVFSRQVQVLGERGDLLIALSGSGNSPNILKAIGVARDLGMETFAATGMFSAVNQCFLRSKHSICVGKDMQAAEEYQLWLGHQVMRELKQEKV